MKAEIINIGTELLLGDTVNTHHSFIARELAALGIDTYHQCCVGDNPERINSAIRLAVSRSQLIITTGGLGPTQDDISKQCVAKALGKKLIYDEQSAGRIRDYFKRQNRDFPENNYNQAYLPENSVILKNEYGTAPGCITEGEKITVIMLPGPPRELIPMWNSEVRPYLEKLSGGVIFSQNVHAFGVSESKADIIISKIEKPDFVTVAPYAKTSEILIRVTAKANTKQEAQAAVEPVSRRVAEALGSGVYGVDCGCLAQRCINLLCEQSKSVSCAESCTGGLIAKMLTDISGASDVFELGEICYSARQKSERLGVSEKTIEEYGVVSRQVAEAMAMGVKNNAKSDFALATTGIAGPGGGTEELPVGTVWIALAYDNGVYSHKLSVRRETADREYIRNYSALYALDMLRRCLENKNLQED